jgi:hypothetical protein
MDKFALNTEGVSADLTCHTVVDVDAKRRERKSIVVVTNMGTKGVSD